MFGRSTETRRRQRNRGYDYLHVAVDDCSRVAFVRVFSDEQGGTTARFLLEAAGFFADHGVRIERILPTVITPSGCPARSGKRSIGSEPATR
jgi:hypothetical protein